VSDTPESPGPEALRYSDAIEELRAILAAIENEGVDLDELSAKVERAAALIRTCRARIQDTELKVKRVLEDLEDGGQ
jgi:exodeoxyribonuclease VII small subunit